MDKRRPVVLLMIVGLALPFTSGTIQAQVDQSALAQLILGTNIKERGRALEAARTIEPQQVGPQLRAALIEALKREDLVQAQRYQADLRGEVLQPQEDPEFIAKVSRAVAALRDTQAIPALVGALGTGSPVPRALVAFGEPALPALLAAVRSPETSEYIVDDALFVFRCLVEGAGPRPLSASWLGEIRRVAKQRLSGKQYFTTIWEGIDLGIALKDKELRRIVDSLASDRGALIARGIDDPDTILETQQRAAQRLAGVPPKRRL